MFPRVRQSIAERLDLIVELATLGEFGVTAELRPVAIGAGTSSDAALALPRLREGCDAPAASSCRDDAPTLS